MSDDRQANSLTATAAADLTAQAIARTARDTEQAVRPALRQCLEKVQEAAEMGLYAVAIPRAELGLTPPHLLALTRELERQGFRARTSTAEVQHVDQTSLEIGWKPVATPRGLSPGGSHLQEGGAPDPDARPRPDYIDPFAPSA